MAASYELGAAIIGFVLGNFYALGCCACGIADCITHFSGWNFFQQVRISIMKQFCKYGRLKN